jgi:CheY-like chemotaxis protein
MLEQSGCEVTIAENGVVALAILDDRQFDLIFMDCHMPEMDGFEATALIREKEAATGSHIPIVAITADVVEGVREKCLDAGMDDYITKPFSSLQLQEILLSWLPGKLTGAEPMAGADKAD